MLPRKAGSAGSVWRTGGIPERLVLRKTAFPGLMNTNGWMAAHGLEKDRAVGWRGKWW